MRLAKTLEGTEGLESANANLMGQVHALLRRRAHHRDALVAGHGSRRLPRAAVRLRTARAPTCAARPVAVAQVGRHAGRVGRACLPVTDDRALDRRVVLAAERRQALRRRRLDARALRLRSPRSRGRPGRDRPRTCRRGRSARGPRARRNASRSTFGESLTTSFVTVARSTPSCSCRNSRGIACLRLEDVSRSRRSRSRRARRPRCPSFWSSLVTTCLAFHSHEPPRLLSHSSVCPSAEFGTPGGR